MTERNKGEGQQPYIEKLTTVIKPFYLLSRGGSKESGVFYHSRNLQEVADRIGHREMLGVIGFYLADISRAEITIDGVKRHFESDPYNQSPEYFVDPIERIGSLGEIEIRFEKLRQEYLKEANRVQELLLGKGSVSIEKRDELHEEYESLALAIDDSNADSELKVTEFIKTRAWRWQALYQGQEVIFSSSNRRLRK